jgi:hypothetical protein
MYMPVVLLGGYGVEIGTKLVAGYAGCGFDGNDALGRDATGCAPALNGLGSYLKHPG